MIDTPKTPSDHTRSSPWYLEALQAFGGWFAGVLIAITLLFILLSMGAGNWSEEAFSWTGLTLGGGLALVTTLLTSQSPKDFSRHLSISLIIGGLSTAALSIWVLTSWDNEEENLSHLYTMLFLLVAWALISLRLKDPILRFLIICGATVSLLSIKFGFHTGHHETGHHERALIITEVLQTMAIAVAFLTLSMQTPRRRFIAEAIAILFTVSLFSISLRDPSLISAGDILTLGNFPWPYWLAPPLIAFGHWQMRNRFSLLSLTTSTLILIAVTVLIPISYVPILMILAGFVSTLSALTGIGTALLGYVLILYYYDLSLTLLQKSALLVTIGTIILVGTLLIRRIDNKADTASSSATPAINEHRQQQTTPARQHPTALIGLAVIAIFTVILGRINIGAYNLYSAFRDAPEVLFPLAPRDPRSLIQGDYMRLNYDQSIFPDTPTALASPLSGSIILRLDENRVARFERFAQTKNTQLTDNIANDTNLIRVKYTRRKGSASLIIVPSSYFFQEGEGQRLANARFAVVKITTEGDARLIGLTDGEFNRLD